MKTLSSYSFSKKELDARKLQARQNVIEPNAERVQPKYFQGFLLQQDAGGYFVLKPSPTSNTMIREDLPHSVGYALALTRDNQ